MHGSYSPIVRKLPVIMLQNADIIFPLVVIMLQLFIAVINENFDIAEEQKKKKQASYYWAMQQPIKASPLWLKRLNPYRWFKANPKAIAVESLPASLVLPMQKSMVEDYPMQRPQSAQGSVSNQILFSSFQSEQCSSPVEERPNSPKC